MRRACAEFMKDVNDVKGSANDRLAERVSAGKGPEQGRADNALIVVEARLNQRLLHV